MSLWHLCWHKLSKDKFYCQIVKSLQSCIGVWDLFHFFFFGGGGGAHTFFARFNNKSRARIPASPENLADRGWGRNTCLRARTCIFFNPSDGVGIHELLQGGENISARGKKRRKKRSFPNLCPNIVPPHFPKYLYVSLADAITHSQIAVP